MKREAVDRWCERGILALTLVILIVGPLALGAVRGLEFGYIMGLTTLVMLVWTVRLWIAPRPRLLWPPICWAVLGFALYAIARYLTADIEYVARQELLHILVYTFVFLAIVNNLQRQETTQIISFTLVFLAMAISFYALYQFLTGSDRVWTFIKPYHHRGSGTYICPNHLGGFLELLLPLGLAYTLTGRVKPVTRILLGYASLAILAGIAATVSRGSWISTGITLAFFFLVLMFQRHYRLPALALFIVIAAACAYAFPKSYFAQKRFNQILDDKGAIDDDMRFALWKPAARMWQDHVWWGVGPAHFNSRFRAYRPEGIQLSPDRTHNDYLNTLTDYGLVGGALVVCALGLLVFGIAKTWRSVRLGSGDLGAKPGRNKFAFMLGASLGLIALLFHSLVDFNMHIPANALLAIALMALLASHIRFATDNYWVGLRHWSQALSSAVLIAGMVYLAPHGWRTASESVWLIRAERAASFSAMQVKMLRRAFAIEPMNGQTAFGIGEALRRQSQEGGQAYAGQEGVSYQRLAQEAMEWFGRAMKLNPYDSRSFSAYGWCLDWLDRQPESQVYFARAEELDPNNYYNLNNIGLHYIQLGDFAAARPWFERSLRLNSQDNPIAYSHLQIANTRLLEAATNEISAKLNVRRQ
jgi:O-antigen ligase